MNFPETWLIAHIDHVILKKFAIWIAMMVPAFYVMGQSSISGQVIDQVTGEGIPGVHVILPSGEPGTYTNLEGSFTLAVQPGIHQLQFSAIGYAITTLSDINIAQNEAITLQISLQEDQVLLEGVVIEAEASLTHQSVLTLERKRGAFAQESLSAEFLNQLGVNQVEEGLTKISGISNTQNGIYVRGLGDRYNNVYFNGLTLPSANPSRKVVELDIVPADMVSNIDVSKIYRANQFSDVSGASIYIHSRQPDAGDFFKVGFGAGFNTQTTGRTIRVSRDSQLNYLGINGSGRGTPVAINGEDFIARLNPDTHSGFQTGFDPVTTTAPLNHNWNLQFEKTHEHRGQKFGLLFSSSYRNSYHNDEGLNLVLDAAQSPVNDFYRRRDNQSTSINGFFSLQYQPNEKWEIDLNYLFINDSENQFVTSQGSTIDFETLRRVRNRFLQKRLNTFQLITKTDLIPDRLRWEVRASTGIARTDEPDRRDLTFLAGPDQNTGTINRNIAAENGRYFQELEEKENNVQSEWTYQFNSNGSDPVNALTLGYQFRDKARSSDFRTFTLITGDLPTENILLEQIDDLLSPQNFENGRFSYRDSNGGERQSRVLRTIQSGYLFYRFGIGQKIELIPGLRLENTDQKVFFKLLGTPLQAPFQLQDFQTTDFLINLNSKYAISENRLLRFGLSQTLTRPNFSELVPAPQVNENLQSTVGRPQLLNSKIWNIDLRYDLFPKAGDLISFGIFYKHIDLPIEQVRSGENFISYFNVNSAEISGVELEWRKDVSSWVRGLFISGNVSLLRSAVNTDPTQIDDPETRDLLTNVTNTSRTLQGASPYLMNLSVSYAHQLLKDFQSNLFAHYHVFGKRILNVGTQQRGDEFELAVHALNLVWQHQSTRGIGITLKASNLLNPRIQRIQAAGPQTQTERVTQSYRQGIRFSASISWTLFDNRL